MITRSQLQPYVLQIYKTKYNTYWPYKVWTNIPEEIRFDSDNGEFHLLSIRKFNPHNTHCYVSLESILIYCYKTFLFKFL